MKAASIRSRMLLAALLPLTLIALLLSAVFLDAWMGDADVAQRQRARMLTRQLASASEYGLFSGNALHLQTIANGAMREADVRSVVILGAQGQLLVSAGKLGYTPSQPLSRSESEVHDSVKRTDLLMQPITASPLKLDDMFESGPGAAEPQPQLLGNLLIEFSRDALIQREQDMLALGVLITLGGLLLAGILAVRLGQGVIQPVDRVSRMIRRIGGGELSARTEVLPNDPLRELQLGLNKMAEHLESNREALEQRVTEVTQALREKKEEAETANLAKSRFLAAASHDLRQPTHALGMFVTRLAQLPHDAQTRHLIENLELSVLAMQDLLDGLLDLSRLDANAIQVQLRAFALADIFDQLRLGWVATAHEKNLRLRIRPSKVWVMSDPALLHRILLNLVSNAVRYTSAGGVLLACRPTQDGKHVRIEVWDSGIGVAPEHQQAIFNEFYQVSNAEHDRGKGMGLGLNIVQRTAQLLGHSLQFESRLGQGSRFSLQVPLVLFGATLEQRSPQRTASFDNLAGFLVLVVEDDPLVREALVSLLEAWGCVVASALDSAQAQWHLAQGFKPDVIVSDYHLSQGTNGMELIRQLRVLAGRQMAACLMSGDTDPDLLEAARREGFSLLHKPVRPAKLRSLIRRLVSANQADGTV